MLRIIVISLFVANLLLLGFQSSKRATRPEAVQVRTVVEDSSIPTIYLFSEIMENRDLMAGNRRCFSLGPFHSEEDRIDVRTQLLEVSASISERQTQALVEKGYWVFMPPYISLLEANHELLSLQALGLNDIGVIYDGDWKNAISLGYFLRQENAVRRKKGLEDRGYAPLIRVQRLAEPRYWLDYEQNSGSDLISLDMQNRPNDFLQRAVPCPEQNIGTDLEGNVETLAENSITTVPDNGSVSTPANKDDEMQDDNGAAVSSQGVEIEAETGSETKTDGG